MSQIIQELKSYFETRLKLLQYETLDRCSVIIAEVIADLAIVFTLIMSFIFFTLALAFFAVSLLGSCWEGFGSVTLIYVLLPLLCHILKKQFQGRLIRLLITKVLKKNENNDR